MPEEELGQQSAEEEPQAPVAPEPEPEPESEPELPPLDESAFDFLREQHEQPQYPQQPPYQQYPQQPPYQQYPQQPQYPQQQGGFDVNQLALDPSGYMPRYISNQMIQNVGPVASAVLEQQKRLDSMIETQVRAGEAQVRNTIDRMKADVFGRSNSFLANKNVQRRVVEQIRHGLADAVDSARRGDFTGIQMMQSPSYYKSILLIAREIEGDIPEDFDSRRPSSIGNAVVETPQKRAIPDEDLDIPADMISAAERMGPGEVEKLKKAYKKYGDMVEFR